MQATSTVTPDLPAPRVDRRLTDGETVVLALMAQGHSNAGIAAALGLSHRTVECHVSRVFDKLALPRADHSWNRRVLAVRWWWLRQAPMEPVEPVRRG